MPSWEDFTVLELKKILNDAEVDYPASSCRKKADYIKLCQSLSKKKFNEAYERFNKSSVSSNNSSQGIRTPRRRTVSRSSSKYVRNSDDDADTPSITIHTDEPVLSSVQASRQARRSLYSNISPRTESPDINIKIRSNRIKHNNNTSTDISMIKNNSNSTLVKAGRFSIPTTDILLSPTSKKRLTPTIVKHTKDKTIEPSMSTHMGNKDSHSIHSYSDFSNGNRSCFVLKESYWPALDPNGNPIRWKIRDPFICDMNKQDLPSSHQSRTTFSEVNHSSSRNPLTKTFLSRKIQENISNAIHKLFRLLLGIMLIIFISYIFSVPIKNSYNGIADKLNNWLNPLPFCEDGISNLSNCIPCPKNAVCKNGSMICKKPQFNKQWYKGRWMCVRNSELYDKARYLLSNLSSILSKHQGSVICNENLTSEAVLLNSFLSRSEKTHDDIYPSYYGFPSCYLENILVKNYSSKKEEIMIIFDELLKEQENLNTYNIRVLSVPSISFDMESCVKKNSYSEYGQVTVYYSIYPQFSFLCKIKYMLYVYGFKVMILAISLVFIIVKHNQLKYHQSLTRAIKKIVEDNTSIQYFSKNEDSQSQGYAIGPRAYDILMMMEGNNIVSQNRLSNASERNQSIFQYNKDYKQFKNLTKKLDEKKIQKMCDDIVRNDSQFCRSLLSVELVPFYYSKKIINKIRNTNYLHTNTNDMTHRRTSQTPVIDVNESQYSGKILI